MQWWLAVLKNYAGFTGRARRTEYWMFALFQAIIGVVLIALWFVPKIGLLFVILSILFWLGTIVPGIAVAVRRMHDQNKPGVWILISLIPFGIGAIWFLVLSCTPGTVGPNQFGPDPKDPNAAPWPGVPGQPYGAYPQVQAPGYPPMQPPYPQQSQYPQGQYPPQAQYPQGQYPPQAAYPQAQQPYQQGQPPYPGQ